MLLKLLDTTVQAADSLEHLVVLMLVAFPLLLCFVHLNVFTIHDFLERVYLNLILLKCLLELAPSRDSLHCETLLPLDLLGQVSDLLA